MSKRASKNETKSGIEARLEKIRAKRGYLLPHHGLMAALSEDLLAGYDAAYTALALDHKVLSVHDRETVWLAVLIATDEALATHHIPKYLQGGGTMDGFAAIARLAAFALGARGYTFLDEHWRSHLESFDISAAYREGLIRAAAPLEPRLAWMAASAIHAAKADHALLRWALVAANRAGVPDLDLAEALSIMMFPGSIPHFVEAARIWLELIRAGEFKPSAELAAWAALDGQGGYDEASGKNRR
jgi:alkylhydroperoxidase/carboxymuconolactone decarboxylase family protein YurZ